MKSVKVGNGNDIEGNDSCAYKSCSWSSRVFLHLFFDKMDLGVDRL